MILLSFTSLIRENEENLKSSYKQPSRILQMFFFPSGLKQTGKDEFKKEKTGINYLKIKIFRPPDALFLKSIKGKKEWNRYNSKKIIIQQKNKYIKIVCRKRMGGKGEKLKNSQQTTNNHNNNKFKKRIFN